VIRRASDEYVGGKRKPGPIPLRTEAAPRTPREHPEFLATVGANHIGFTIHPDDDTDEESLTDTAHCAAVATHGQVALTWPVTRIEPRNDAARLAVPDVLYPTGAVT
jgi:hypothetical protein